MANKEIRYSQPLECLHCSNTASMPVVASCHTIEEHAPEDVPDASWEAGPVWEILRCPACKEITIRTYHYHEGMEDDEEEPSYTILYPGAPEKLNYLPTSIAAAYEAANRVRSIDPNAYGVLLGRLLDKVCMDKGAAGGSLFERLRDLATQGVIPGQLADMAHQLRQLRNIGAHADLGELTPQEIPVLGDLCKAILEYVYRAPMLVQQVQTRIATLRQPNQP